MRTTPIHLTLLITALLAAPALAEARTERFDVRVSGLQTTTWSYDKQRAPTCDYPETASGSQEISFASSSPLRLRIREGARPQVLAATAQLRASASLKRTQRRLYSQLSACTGKDAYGEGRNTDETGGGTCEVEGGLTLRLGPTRASVFDPQSPYVPARARAPRAGSLVVRADPDWKAPPGSLPLLPAQCGQAGQRNADIGIVQGQGEVAGALIEASTRLSRKRLFGKRGRARLKIDETFAYPNTSFPRPGPPATKGTTRLKMTLTLRRLAR